MVDAQGSNPNETSVAAEQSGADATPSTINASVRSESISASNISDQAAKYDQLGFNPYVEAIAEFLTNDATKPPLTLSIEGEWGSGKSSFMQQLQVAIEQLEMVNKRAAEDELRTLKLKTVEQQEEFKELSKADKREKIRRLRQDARRRKNRPLSKQVWFNAWRHDKVEALWAAFALEFLRQISQPKIEVRLFNPKTWFLIFNPEKWKEFGQMRISGFKLFWLRFNWQDNKFEALRIATLGLFFGLLGVSLPILFFTSGTNGINLLSDRVLCRLSPPEEAETEEESISASPSAAPQVESEGNNCLTGFTNVLLWLGGFGGTTTGALALLAKAGEIMGDPKNDLKQYLESPDYDSKVAFIEQFHEDFEKIVSTYGGEGNKVYVFIDDLDRCELTKAADLMQGLNLLISNDPNLIFILGMDREKVAAGIALKQKDVLPYLSSPAVVLNQAKRDNQTELKGLEYGYAYIEKFVQLPFQVPKASADNFKAFLGTLAAKTASVSPPPKSQRFTVFRRLWLSVNYRLLRRQRPELDRPSGETLSPRTNSVNQEPMLSRRETIKVELTEDSETVQQIILKVAPALDYNPRRIKQFINLFRLKVFIASNTGLFDEVSPISDEADTNNMQAGKKTQPLTLEQLGKFTALCMKYPLLQVDLEDRPELLKHLQQYALDPDAAKETETSPYDEATQYWGSNPTLVKLLRTGCEANSGNQMAAMQDGSTPNPYNLATVDVNQLLQVSPPVQPIDRVPLRSERGVDYRTLRELLRAKQWEAADKETYQMMLKAADREDQGYLGIPDIEQFPCQDLQTIDQLWVTASEGKFGFSVQKELYVECGGILNGQYHEEAWNQFCEKNGWKENGNYVSNVVDYDITSPKKAHLPFYIGGGGPRIGTVFFSRIQTCRL